MICSSEIRFSILHIKLKHFYNLHTYFMLLLACLFKFHIQVVLRENKLLQMIFRLQLAYICKNILSTGILCVLFLENRRAGL